MAVELVHPDIRAAFRSRLLTLVKATTGSMSLTAAANVITRASGSFVTDGFIVGDEVMVSGFTASPVRAMVTAVAALSLTLDTTVATGSATASVVAGLPQGRHWEGFSYFPTVGRPFVVETMLTPDSTQRALGNGGTIEHRIESICAFVYPAGIGTRPIETMAGAFLAHFAPGTGLSYGSTTGTITAARRASGLLQQPDWLRLTLTASITAYTVN